MTQTLRLVSWNVQHLAGGYSNYHEIVRVLTGLKPDVVLLQECDFGTFRSRGANQAKCIATAMEMKAISASAMRFGGGFYGLAILTKHAVNTVMTIPVPWTSHAKEARILTAIIGPLLPGIANVHLNHEPPGAARNELLRLLPQVPAWVRILIGDFNHPPGEGLPAPWLEKSSATNGRYMPTWPSSSPRAALDRIIVKDGTLQIKARIIAEPITDHLPLYAELES
jgi:endonuclease/exonuclease/phosphatase family metal-dependent hydrolase